MQYRDSRSVAPGRITGFTIRSLINNALIWDVTDPVNVKQVRYTKTGDNFTFKSTTDSLKTYMAFTLANAMVPLVKPAAIPNQDLHSSAPADMIIITHPLFSSYAEKLASLHTSNDGLITQIVTPEQKQESGSRSTMMMVISGKKHARMPHRSPLCPLLLAMVIVT